MSFRAHCIAVFLAALVAPVFTFSVVLAAPAAQLQPLRAVEGVTEYRLANGLQVLLIPDASKPTVTVNVTYRVGSRHENAGETGMAHLLEHLLFRSTKRYAHVGIELARRGMQFNGTTSADRTNYYATFPADASRLAWALQLEAERMTGALVQRKDLDSEMTVVRNEMEAGENSPVRILMQRTVAAAYQWHAYGRDTIGARSDIENVDIPRLQAFYRRHYQPDNATLIVAGAFDPQAALVAIQTHFGRLPRPARVLATPYTQEPVQEGERQVSLRRVGGEQALVAVYHVPPLASSEAAALEVAVTALADTPSGRLHQRLVQAGKATQVFGWATRSAEPGLLLFGAVLKTDQSLDDAQRGFVDTIEGLRAEPVTAAELQRAQQQWVRNLERVLADPQALCVTLSEFIAAGDWRLLFLLRDRIEAVTVEQVNTALQRWLLPSNRTLGRFIATASPERTPLAGRADAAEALKDFRPRAAAAAGEAFDASPATIDRRTERYTLPSGLRVALLPKRTRGESVELLLNLHFGSLPALQGQRTAAALVGAMLATGTKTKSRSELADAFTALKADWRVGSSVLEGADAALSTRKAQLAPALKLLAEVLREPAFAAAEFEQLVRQRIGEREAWADDAGAVAGITLRHAETADLPAADPRRLPTLAQGIAALKALRLEDVQAFHRNFWGAQNGELAIVGDFDAATIKPLIAQLFGDWRSPQPYARIAAHRPALVGQRFVSPLKDKANAVAQGSMTLALNDDHPDYAALRLAAHVLGDGGMDSRLMARLRQKDGLSYGAGASLWASSFDPLARIDLYAQFAPENRARVEGALAEELQRFVREGLTAAELDNAKKAMKAASDTWRVADGAVAWAWTGHLERQRSFAWNAALDARGQALTLAQVNAAIRQWLDPARVNWSLAGEVDKPQVPAKP